MKRGSPRASQLIAHQVAVIVAAMWIDIIFLMLTAATTVWLYRAVQADNRFSMAAAVAALFTEGFGGMFLIRARAAQARRNAALFDDPDEH